MRLENDFFRIHIRQTDGAIDSFFNKKTQGELITEPRLACLYRLCASTADYQCNYIDSEHQKTAPQISAEASSITIFQRGLSSPQGMLDIALRCTITLTGDTVSFSASLTNYSDDCEISEFWFPRLGGITQFDEKQSALLATPGYLNCTHRINLVSAFPAGKGLGADAAEWHTTYPGALVMPWWDFYDQNSDSGLYFGYHDRTMRLSTWHCYLYPNRSGFSNTMMKKEQACGEPIGLVFSHVRYPFLKKDETLESGAFIVRAHDGDWHTGSMYYRNWFLENFPFNKKGNWLREKSAWFSSIIYQPEDKVVADYQTYDQWCRDAEKYGVSCHELIGWDKGGLERDYPQYEPEEKLGGHDGFCRLMESIRSRDAKKLVFVNYNVLDSCTPWYKEELHRYAYQDSLGSTPNWMCWGESTLLARSALSVRRHHLSSVIEPMENILHRYFLDRVKDGADGFQIDKLCVGSLLDFNPLNTQKPDIAACEGLIAAIGRLYRSCREINPTFCLASEMCQDRLIQYIDVGYRNSGMYCVSPLRYVFPEWTSCHHISEPFDFLGVNSAVMTGSVMCIEPEAYQSTMAAPIWQKLSSYIAEVERIRTQLRDIIFTGIYCDECGASVQLAQALREEDLTGAAGIVRGEAIVLGDAASNTPPSPAVLHFRVHQSWDKKEMALIVINSSEQPIPYHYHFDAPFEQAEVVLYAPFEEPRTLKPDALVALGAMGLHILVAKLP